MVHEVFLPRVHNETLLHMSLYVGAFESFKVMLTPCEWTIPLGVPVVPEENITTSGVSKGTCSNFNSQPMARARNSSKVTLKTSQQRLSGKKIFACAR